jgi:long-subunit fatty acid transport protein
VLAAWSPARAQTSLQVPIQFDFLNPSARSLALGGAFVGLADDATAALVNPAGLIALTLKEVSIEGRYRGFDQPFLAGGRLSGIVTRQGVDTSFGPVFETLSESSGGLNFASFVFPRGRVRVAGIFHRLIDVEQDFSYDGVIQSRGFDTRDTALTAERSLNVDTYGASVAFDARRVWVGGGVLIQRFSLGFDLKRFAHDDLYGVADPRQQLFNFTQDGGGTAAGVVVGALVPISTAKLGVSYKRAPRFDFESFSGGLVGSQERTTATFKVPDVFAVGASLPVGDAFLITSEYTWVFYSQVTSEYVEVLARQGESRDRLDRFTIDDAGEFHFGVEYLLPMPGRPAVRGGFWFDPDHSVHYAPTDAFDLLDERISTSLSSGEDLWHYTLGTMIQVHPRLDLSAALDRSSRSTVVSASMSFRF